MILTAGAAEAPALSNACPKLPLSTGAGAMG